jgi:hypothetical protein
LKSGRVIIVRCGIRLRDITGAGCCENEKAGGPECEMPAIDWNCPDSNYLPLDEIVSLNFHFGVAHQGLGMLLKGYMCVARAVAVDGELIFPCAH